MKTRPRAGVIIVNFNCAPLAIDSALSALGSSRCDVRVVIVDNFSTDDSRDYFRDVQAGKPARNPQSPAASPAVRFCDIGRMQAATILDPREWSDAPLTFLLARENRGFAAGVNLGLRSLLAGDFDILIILNPDALLAEGAIEAFAERLRDPRVGLCGASVLSFDEPTRIQALGGAALDPLTLVGRNIGEGAEFREAPDENAVEAQLDYPLGAAIAFRPDYVRAAGLLDERYFLYFEEADWTLAGRAAHRVGWAREAVVYHRYGASTKSRPAMRGAASRRSPLSDYHMARSRRLFAMKWRPMLAPLMVALGAGQALARAARGRGAQARAVALGSLPGASRSFSP